RGDPLGCGVPQADDAASIEQKNAVGDVSEHASRVRALLDLRIPARAIDGERDPSGNVFRESKVVCSVRLPAARASNRDRAKGALTHPEGGADQSSGLDAGEELARVLPVGALAERGDD